MSTSSEKCTPVYCIADLSKNTEEDYELQLCMLNLVAHHVAKEENWLHIADNSKHWGKGSEEYRSWVEEEKAKIRKEEKDSESAKESLDNTTTSPLDRDCMESLECETISHSAHHNRLIVSYLCSYLNIHLLMFRNFQLFT